MERETVPRMAVCPLAETIGQLRRTGRKVTVMEVFIEVCEDDETIQRQGRGVQCPAAEGV